MGACWTVATQSICLPIFYHSFLHACWYCVSLFAIPACMMSHDQPCLLVWSLTIGHAFWCDASLSAMPSGVLSHHRPHLLVWSLIINRGHWCGASLQAMSAGQLPLQLTFLLVECRWKDGYKSDATCTEVSSHQTCSGPLADSHEIKVFYKGYFRQNKGYFIEILTKKKSKSMSNFRVILWDPDL